MRGILGYAPLWLRLLGFLVSTAVHIPEEAVWALTSTAWTSFFRSTTANKNFLLSDSRNSVSIDRYFSLAGMEIV